MKKIKYLVPFIFIFSLLLISCEEEDDSEPEQEIVVNTTSIIPTSQLGRENNYLGCIEISSRITTISVWDHGTVDGDIVSIIANGNTIIDERTLDGPSNPISVDYDFGYNGFNYVTLYAHNLGSISPNTCTISINGVEFILEANLDANGAIDVIVGGYGVDCTDASGGNGGGNGGSGKGDVKFWTNQDYGCGPITVNLTGVGSSTITGYYGVSPNCDQDGFGGNFNYLTVGTYNYTASCQDYTWNGTVNITEDNCLRFQLTL
ncbi:hypothetical protein QRD02_09640 [Aequorivita sp. SDUM287046]|uniref:Lipoprotein n=1 Tax=Aequorivita aurantiaca TaxID=3053356 RepID=A0ABT8DGY2_9FLAO|nr:hypothetical protein [Aequorivita aurantiaca]MDN3724646.1 hypothetical protein [Aequorivita aurantiaca]